MRGGDKSEVPFLSEQLRLARSAAGLSLAQTVSRVHRSRPLSCVVWQLEKGKGKLSVLRTVAAALGRTLHLPDIAVLRKQRGLSRHKLSKLANVHADTLRKMEIHPANALLDRAERVYRALGHPLKLKA